MCEHMTMQHICACEVHETMTDFNTTSQFHSFVVFPYIPISVEYRWWNCNHILPHEFTGRLMYTKCAIAARFLDFDNLERIDMDVKGMWNLSCRIDQRPLFDRSQNN